MLRFTSVVVGAIAALASNVHAQATSTPDSSRSPFRAGQWGVQFLIASGATELGVLRFSTPLRAWVFDASGSTDRESNGNGPFTTGNSQTIVSASAGPRWYGVVVPNVVRFVGAGVNASVAHAETDGQIGTSDSWSAGAYGEGGATYLVTSHIGLGMRAMLTVARTEMRQDVPSLGLSSDVVEKFTDWRVSLAPLQLVGTLYF